jgi:CheY-like chemotaxis protein
MTNNPIAGKKVLLVEDDKFYVDLVARKLSNSNCTFSYDSSGDNALVSLQKNIPDVILLDIMLPGTIDGFGVLEKIKKDDKLKNIPVIILSNLSGPQDIERGMKLGAFRYLVKSSIVPSDIIKHIESVFISGVK